MIIGKDLRCMCCGHGAKDVAPDLDLTPAPNVHVEQTFWRCINDHKNVTTVRRLPTGLSIKTEYRNPYRTEIV